MRCFRTGFTKWSGEAAGTGGDPDESSGRAYAPGFDGVRRLLFRRGTVRCRMLASNGMRLARELRSPLAPGSRSLAAAALFFGGGLGRLVAARGSASRRSCSRSCCSRRRARRPALRRASCRSPRSRSGARSRSRGRSSPTAAGATRTARSSTSPSRSSARSSAREPRRLLLRLLRAARRRLRLVARREGAAVAVRGLRPDRAPARADRLLERARAARRHRAADRALPRDPACERPGRCSSTAGSS